MKIEHTLKIQDDGVTISGQITNCIFDDGEELGNFEISVGNNFYIKSVDCPELTEVSLYVWGDNYGLNNDFISYEYISKSRANEVMDTINSITIKNEIVEKKSNKRMVVTRGIPASGKSTWAIAEAFREGAYIITKDEIRKNMGVKDNFSKKSEELVVAKERATVSGWASSGKEYIIIHNTHMGANNKHIAYYEGLAKTYGYDFEIKDFKISRADAIERDTKRSGGVGKDVIDKMIKIGGKSKSPFPENPIAQKIPKSSLPPAFIFDIDGTLAFMNGNRSPYDYSRVHLDDVNEYLLNLMHTLSSNHRIIIVSGRDGGCFHETVSWLKSKNVPYDEIYMRDAGDNITEDSDVKFNIYKQYIEGKHNVLGVFDDRNRVVDMWRNKLCLPTYQVWYGDF